MAISMIKALTCGYMARSEGLKSQPHRSVGVGTSSRTVRQWSSAGPIFQSCPPASGVVQRLGYSLGYSRGGTGLILDRLLFRPDISPVGRNHASVMRCCRSVVLAAGCCFADEATHRPVRE